MGICGYIDTTILFRGDVDEKMNECYHEIGHEGMNFIMKLDMLTLKMAIHMFNQ